MQRKVQRAIDANPRTALLDSREYLRKVSSLNRRFLHKQQRASEKSLLLRRVDFAKSGPQVEIITSSDDVEPNQ